MILMHGFGASMYDLVNLAPSINHNDFIYVFPNAPLEIELGFNQTGYAWFPIESQNYQESSKLLNKTIDEALSMGHKQLQNVQNNQLSYLKDFDGIYLAFL